MKPNKLFIILSAIMMLATSCTDFDELNIDPVRLNKVNPGSLLNPVLYDLAIHNWNQYNGFTFQLMQGKVSLVSTSTYTWYIMDEAAGDGRWSTSYRLLNNIMLMEEMANELNEPNYVAIGMTLRSYIFHILADMFGNVPMMEACKARENNFTPKFDDQKAIYHQILNDLKDANDLFVTASSGAGAGLRYNGDGDFLYGARGVSIASADAIVNWKRLCNSLRLRVLMRVIDVPEFNALQEIRTILADATTYPVFTSNANAALLLISGIAPMQAPMTNIVSFRNNLRASQFFVETFKLWNDPRLPLYATETASGYHGLQEGYVTVPAGNTSEPNQQYAQWPLKICLMSYAEIEFIKAELAQRGLIEDDAEEAYKKGVEAAILQWERGITFPADYFDNEHTKYDGTLERILFQKFHALFFCDYQQWFEHLRTGLPEIPRGPGVASSNRMPQRLKYPTILQRTNQKNYEDVRNIMGGDDFYVKLFWQK